jgi:polysaccharide biosynthesis protein PslH
MRILFVTPTWPFPMNSGSKARMAKVLNLLMDQGVLVDIHYVKLNRHADDDLSVNFKFNKVSISEFRSNNLLKVAHDWFRNGFMGTRLYKFYHSSINRLKQITQQVQKRSYYDKLVWSDLSELVKTNEYDIIWFNYAIWGCYPIELFTSTRKIVDTHDVLHMRQSNNSGGGISGFVADYENEVNWLSKFDTVIAIQESEKGVFDLMGMKNTKVLGHHVEIVRYDTRTVADSIVFIGSINDVNIETLSYIENEIILDVKSKYPQLRFVVAGKIASFSKYATDRINDLDDLSNIYIRAILSLNPVQHGTGLKIKNIESLAHGVPVVTSGPGSEGISDCQSLFICNNKLEYLDAISQIIETNAQLNYSENAYSFVEAYNEKQVDNLIDIIDKTNKNRNKIR